MDEPQPQPTVSPVDTPQALSPEALAALFLAPMYGSKVDGFGKEGKSTGFDIANTDKMLRSKSGQLQNSPGWLSSYYDPLTKSVNVDSYGYRGIKPPELSFGDKRDIIRSLQRAYPAAEKVTGFKPGGELATVNVKPQLERNITGQLRQLLSSLNNSPQSQKLPLPPIFINGQRAGVRLNLPGQTGGGAMPGTRISDIW